MQRYQTTQQDSFFGDFILQRAVPRDHFLVQLRELIDWRPFTRELSRLYRGQAEQGRPPYEPALLLKMLFVSYLYHLSDRQTEEAVRDSLSLRHFLGLAVDAPVPDATTLVVFRSRLLRRGRAGAPGDLWRGAAPGAPAGRPPGAHPGGGQRPHRGRCERGERG